MMPILGGTAQEGGDRMYATPEPPTLSEPPPDPKLQRDVEAMAEEVHQRTVQEIGSAAPKSTQPLAPDRVNALAEVLAATIDEVGDGHLPQLQPQQVKGNQTKLPPDVYAPLVAVFSFLEQLPEGERYRADVVELAKSSEGLGELIRLLAGVRTDPRLQRAIRQQGMAALREGGPSTDLQTNTMGQTGAQGVDQYEYTDFVR